MLESAGVKAPRSLGDMVKRLTKLFIELRVRLLGSLFCNWEKKFKE